MFSNNILALNSNNLLNNPHIVDKVGAHLKLKKKFNIFKRTNIKKLLTTYSKTDDYKFNAIINQSENEEDGLETYSKFKHLIKNFLKKDKSWQIFKKNLLQMLDTIIPAFEREGKSYLSIGIGCTGGQHRSVFVAEQLYMHLLDKKHDVKILHTNLHK